MNNIGFLVGIFRVILLVLIQTMIFSQLNLFGFINPMIYALFFYWYPQAPNQTVFLVLSFLFGLLLDVFLDTLAINAMVCVTLAGLRPIVQKFSFGVNQDLQTLNLTQTAIIQRYGYLLILIFLSNSLFIIVEVFSFSHILLILKKISTYTIFGFVFASVLASLFTFKKN